MEVKTIGVVFRYSREDPRHGWQSLELKVEASLDPVEAPAWREKAAELHGQLKQEFNTLWAERQGAERDARPAATDDQSRSPREEAKTREG